MRKEQICTIHDRIIEAASDIYKLSTKHNNMTKEEMRDALYDIERLCNDIENNANEAKERGQAMEDRLYIYKQGIEELGFVRK